MLLEHHRFLFKKSVSGGVSNRYVTKHAKFASIPLLGGSKHCTINTDSQAPNWEAVYFPANSAV